MTALPHYGVLASDISGYSCKPDKIFEIFELKTIWLYAHVAQTVERFLGKEEVHRFDSDRGLQLFLNRVFFKAPCTWCFVLSEVKKIFYKTPLGGRDGEGKI